MNNLVTENESLKFEVNRLKANKADLRKQMGLLENSESDKVKAIEELAGIKESLKSQNKKQDELILKLECECKVKCWRLWADLLKPCMNCPK